MRDKARIHVFCDKLADIWENKCPDWRFGQMMMNVLGAIAKERDPFFLEEDEMMKRIEDYFGGDGKNVD